MYEELHVNNSVKKAVHLYKNGNVDEAKQLTVKLVKKYPKNEKVWFLLSLCVDDDEQKKFCLSKTLELNPDNLQAIHSLNEINRKHKITPSFVEEKCPYCQKTIVVFMHEEIHVCKYCEGGVKIKDNHIVAVSSHKRENANEHNKLEVNHQNNAVSPLQKYANRLIKNGWTIRSMTDQQFIATKRKDINGLVALFGIVGLLFYLIPGLLILLIGYTSRGTKTSIVTSSKAQAWLTKAKKSQAETKRLQAEKKKLQEARKVVNDKKIAELSGSPLRFWYMMSDIQRTLLVIGIITLIMFLAMFYLS